MKQASSERRLAGRQVDQPEPGFFELKLVRGGPRVGAKILLIDGLWAAIIDGVHQGGAHVDPACASGVMYVWHNGTIIEESLYDFRLALKAWAVTSDHTHPAANARQPIALKARRSLF